MIKQLKVPIIRYLWIGCTLLLILGALGLGASGDLLSELTKPLIIKIVSAFGLTAKDLGSSLQINQLSVPWTSDCSGASILAVMWAILLWTHLYQKPSWKWFLSLVAAIPLAFLCNIARILSLLCYRALFFPAVETASFHYFVGFLWMLPLLPFLIRWGQTKDQIQFPLAGIIHVSATLALTAPLMDEAGGWLIASCSLFLLAHGIRTGDYINKKWHFAGIAWIFVGSWIFTARMESLWLPWLLLNPWTFQFNLKHNFLVPFILPGTLPIFAMHREIQILVTLILVTQAIIWARSNCALQNEDGREFVWKYNYLLIPFFCFPLLAPKLDMVSDEILLPPASCEISEINPTTYRISLIGQPNYLQAYWFTPQGDGRHHTLKQCLLFRGVQVEESGELGVWTDHNHWLTEYFLFKDIRVDDYKSYLTKTFLPFSEVGIHLVIASDQSRLSASDFRLQANALSQRLSNLIRATDAR